MNKKILVTHIILVTYGLANEDIFSVDGNLRAGFISDYLYDDSCKDTLSLGGHLSIESKYFYDFIKSGATISTTNSLFQLNENGTFLNSEKKSYSIVNQAYLKAKVLERTFLTFGRKFIDTPFINSDDIGMIPNSYEVFLIENNSLKNLNITLGNTKRWSGVDSETPENFERFKNSYFVGLNYSNKDFNSQLWYYDGLLNDIEIGYFDIDKTFNFQNMNLNIGVQMATESVKNGDDNFILGLKTSLFLNESMNVFGAVNGVFGDLIADNGLGGGSFYTSLEQNTIGSVGKDALAFMFGGEYLVNDKISLSFASSYIDSNRDDYLTELDLSGEYLLSKTSSLKLIFSEYTNFQNNNFSDSKENSNLRIFYNQKIK